MRWTLSSIGYQAIPPKEWSSGGMAFKAAAWHESDYRRDWRGRFARKPGPGPEVESNPSAPPPSATPVAKRPTKSTAPAVPTVKPVLYTEDRQDIVDMGFHSDPDRPEALRDAVTLVRERKPLTAEQLTLLADAVREHNKGPDVLPGKRRSNVRVANWLDAAAAEIQGREAPELPGRTGVRKIKPEDLNRGDTVALVGRDGAPEIVTVRSTKKNSWGVVELGVEHLDGREETRPVLGKSAAYLLPDLPGPKEVPPVTTGPRREHVHPDRLRPGDTVEDAHGTRYAVKKSAQTTPYDWDVTLQQEGGKEKPFVAKSSAYYGEATFIRTARGKGSSNQTWDAVMRPENPTPVTAEEVEQGDRVRFNDSGVTGSVLKTSYMWGPKGSTRVRLTVQEDNGFRRDVSLDPKIPVTRLIEADDNVDEWVRQQKAQSEINLARGRISVAFAEYRLKVREAAVARVQGVYDKERAATWVRDMEIPPSDGLMRSLGGELAPDREYAEKLVVAERFDRLAKEIAQRELENVARSIAMSKVLPRESGPGDALDRVFNTLLKAKPPAPSEYRDVSDALARMLPKLKAGPGEAKPPRMPTFAKSADLKRRMAGYREAIGKEFGARPVTRTLPYTPSLADLEAGIAPEVHTVTDMVKDRAADRGPGKFAMKHLDIVRAAGRDLAEEIADRVDERYARELDKLKAEQEKNYDKFENMFDRQANARDEARNRLAVQFGYSTWDDLLLELSKARAAGDQATVERLEKFRDEINEIGDEATDFIAEEERQLQQESLAIGGKMRSLDTLRAEMRRAAVLEVIAEVRGEPMGGQLTHQITGPESGDNSKSPTIAPTDQDRKDLTEALDFATSAYPRSWVEHLNRRGPYRLKRVARGYYNHSSKIVALSDQDPNGAGSGRFGEVAVHELGHGMEKVVPGLLAAENAFMWSRTSKGEVGERKRENLEQIYPHLGDEFGWRDDFSSPYSGKDYGGVHFELFTTGVQELTGGGSGYLDDDFTNWTLGVLALL